jgi:hypothetical protein
MMTAMGVPHVALAAAKAEAAGHEAGHPVEG